MEHTMTETSQFALDCTTSIIEAFVSHNDVHPAQLPALIVHVHAAVRAISETPALVEETPKTTPAQIRKSITPDALISFVDGKPYKTLGRHLRAHGLSRDEYRAKYGLPADYPMTAANYSAQRSELAKALGLGQIRKGKGKGAAKLKRVA
jgi:predicted transcriptional regulator